MTTTPDPRPALDRATALVADLLRVTTPEDLDRPTPCAEWDVRVLVSHLVAVTHRVAHLAGGGRPEDTARHVDGVADDEWSASFAAGRERLLTAWADDAVLTRTLVHPAGAMPGFAAGTVYVQEFTVHAGDLATAIGRTDLLDEGLAEGALADSVRFLPASPRGGPIPFGPVVEVPADAPAHVRLAGWLGRPVAS